jgi:hypothetical protein
MSTSRSGVTSRHRNQLRILLLRFAVQGKIEIASRQLGSLRATNEAGRISSGEAALDPRNNPELKSESQNRAG